MKFRFSVDPDGELDGNDASAEHFAGHRLKSVAKELGQNTNDARSKEATKDGVPAVIAFEKIAIPAKHIPDINGLVKKLEGCALYARNHLKKDDLASFFEKSVKKAKASKINALRISDWNTTGLEGPYAGTSPLIAFAKGHGVSKKSSESAAGSRGIGKNAIFTISDLGTIFYSTLSLNQATERLETYTQGKSSLISDIRKNEVRKGTGYCGLQGALPLEGEKGIPDWLDRNNHVPKLTDRRGLSMVALGFDQGRDWHLKLASSALSTFFSAIQQGFLEFRIKNSNTVINIDKQSYMDCFDNKEIVSALEKDELDSLEKAKCYAQVLKDAEVQNGSVIVEYFESTRVGKFRLCIRVEEGLPKKLALIRKGMLITESLQGLKAFPGKDFVAVLQATTDKGIEFIRSLEGAEHNALEPDRIKDKTERQKAVSILTEITKKAREVLYRHIKDEVVESDEIVELADYFPYEQGEDDSDNEKDELNPMGKLRLMPKKKHASIQIPPYLVGPGSDTGTGRGTGPGPSPGDDPRLNRGSGLTAKITPIQIKNVRAPLSLTNPTKRRLCFTVVDDGTFELALGIAGSDESEPIGVISSTVGSVENGRIHFNDYSVGSRVITDIELSRPFSGALRVFAYKNEEKDEAVA